MFKFKLAHTISLRHLVLAGLMLSNALPIQTAQASAPASAPATASASLAAAPAAAPAAGPVGPQITATLADSLVTVSDIDGDGKADPGDTLRYTAIVTNTGTDATGLNFDLSLDSNTTLNGLVNASPVGVNDTYAVIGNVPITVPANAGVLSNDFLGLPSGSVSLSAPISSTQGGLISVSADGGFTYTPPPGYEGNDTVVYTLTNPTGVNTGTLTLQVNGMIWFIDNSAPACTTLAAGCGGINKPLSSLATFQTLNNGTGNNPASGDNIFVYETGSNYTGGVSLLNSQKLIGEGASQSLATITGLSAPLYSAALPSTGGNRPKLTHTTNNVTLGSGNTVRGLDIDSTGGTALFGSNIGALKISELSVTNTNTSTSCVAAVDLSSGSPDVAFTRVNASNCAYGMKLNGTTGSIKVLGDAVAAQNNSGGVISNSTVDGILADTVSNLQLARMTISGSAANGINGRAVNGFVSEYNIISGNGNAVEEFGIRFADSDLAAPSKTGLMGSTVNGANPTIIANTLVEQSGEFNIYILNTSGALSDLEISGLTSRNTNLSAVGADGFYIETRGSSSAKVNVAGSTFSNNSTEGIQGQALNDSTLIFNVNGAASTFSGNNTGIVLSHGNNADLSSEINGATFTGQPSAAILVSSNSSATASASLNARILNNNVTSPADAVFHSIIAFASGSGTPMNVEIVNNVVNHQGIFSGIFVDTPDLNSTPVMNARVTGNTVTSNSTGSHGIVAQNRRLNSSLCVRAQSNTVTGINTSSFAGVRVRQASSGVVNMDAGVSGSSTPLTVLQDNNPSGNINAFSTAGTITVVPVSTCSAPTLLGFAAQDEMLAATQPPTQAIAGHHGGGKILAAPRAKPSMAPPDNVSVNVGTLPSGESVIIRFDAMVNKPIPAGVLSVSMQGTVSGGNFSSVLTNDPKTVVANDATVTLLDIKADLAISKAVTGSGVPGQALTYTLAFTNAGPQPAVNVVITDQLPITLTNPSVSSNAAITQTGATPFVWDAGTLDVGEGGVITVTGIVSNVRASSFANTADIGSSIPDTNTLDNQSSVNATVPNIAPVAQDDTAGTNEDTPVTITVKGNDSDLNNDSLSVASVVQPSNGAVGITGATVRYTPTLNFFGSDVFTYTLSDGVLTDTARVTVTVNAVNDAPVAQSAGDQSVFVEANVTLDGSASDDVDGPLPLSYGWQQVGGPAISMNGTLSQPVFVAPSAPSVLTFTLVVMDDDGLPSAPVTTTITVTDIAISGLSASNDGPTTMGDATQFTATIGAGSNVSYAWAFGDGATGSGATPSHNYASVGAYTATVTATNSVTVVVTTTSVTVFDVAIDGLSAINNSPTTLGDTTQFTASIGAGTNAIYAWAFGDGTIGSGATPSHVYSLAGNYTATVTATNSAGSSVATTLVQIDDVAINNLQAVNDGPTELGNFTTLTATVANGTGVDYAWDFGDGDSGFGDLTSHQYADIGTYTATVTATNSVGQQSATTVVVVDEAISGLMAQADSITILGDSTQLTASVSAGSRVSYAWDFGDGATGVGDALTHSYTAIGTYTATVTATNSVGQHVSDVQLVIVDVPAQGLNASNDSPNTVNQATLFSATIGGGTGVSYVWAFGDGTTGSGAAPVHVYSAAGSYMATVTASNSSGDISTTTTVTIWPEPTIAFESAAYSVDEGVGTVLMTVTLDVASSVPVTVSYVSTDGDAVAPSDYDAISGTLVFTPGVTAQTIAASIHDDGLDEVNEGFTVTLSAPVSATLGTPMETALTILDDDAPPAVQWSFDDYSAMENAVGTVITAELSAQSGLTVSVAYSTSDVTANAPADYIGQSGVLTFAPGTTVQTFTVALVDDALDEGDESVVLSLAGPVNASLGGRSSAMLTLLDDEVSPTVQFDSAAYTVTESAGNATITVTLSAPSALVATVGYTVTNGDALAPSDFVAASGVLTFAPGQLTQTFTVVVNDDVLDELDESVALSLEGRTNVDAGAPALAVLTIQDDDVPPSVTMAAPTHSDDESAAQASIHVQFDAPSGLTATVAYSVAEGTASAPADFTAATGTLTFAPGMTETVILVTLSDDALDELDETVLIEIGDAVNATLGAVITNELMILDNDVPPTLAIVPVAQIVDEGNGNAVVTVTLDAPSALTVTVDYASVDGGAVAPADYAAISGTVVFAPGEVSQKLALGISDDAVYEGDEMLDVALSNPNNAALSAGERAIINIADNDPAPVAQLAVNGLTVAEGIGSVGMTVTLDVPAELTATLRYTLTDGSASAPQDYVRAGDALTFTPGMTEVVIAITINDDALDENVEQFDIWLDVIERASAGAIMSATVDIVDNDVPPFAQFAELSYSVDEGAGMALVTVTLSGPSGLTVTVPYTLIAGTAMPVADYADAAGALVFAPGITEQVIQISIVDDVIDEADETLTLLLQPDGGTLAPQRRLPSVELTIVDNDPQPSVRFSRGNYAAREGDGTVMVTATLSQPSSFTVTVDYATSDSSATAPDDYTAAQGTLTFAPGSTQASFAIGIVDDAVDELSEGFRVALSNPISGTLGTPVNANISISDNDGAPAIRFEQAAYTVSEGIGTLLLPVMLDARSTALTVTVNYAMVDESASAPDDYIAANGTLTFAPGVQVQMVAVSVISDSAKELTETLSVKLSDAVNGQIDVPDTTQLSILDDDSRSQPDTRFYAYMPVLLANYGRAVPATLPDLVVKRIVVLPNDVQVVIENQGSGPVTQSFWVDLYVNPQPMPLKVNDVWNDGRSQQGATWGVTGAAVPIAAHGQLTLTVGSAYWNAAGSHLTGIKAGDVVVVQVDSASTIEPTIGGVRESHEADSNGGSYNNISSVTANVAMTPPLATAASALAEDWNGLPGR